MNKWLWLGVAALLLLWTPFLYRELVSKAPEAPDRDRASTGDFGDGEEDTEADAPPKSLLAVAPAKPAEPERPSVPAPAAVEPPPPAEEPEEPQEPETAENSEGAAEQAPGGAPTAVPTVGPVAELRSAFEEETRDAFWAGPQEGVLRELATKYEFAMADQDNVECRRTVCRLSVHMSQEKPTNLLRLFSDAKNEINQAAAMEPAGPNDDITHVFMYVTRKGYELAGSARQ